jgi:hypothetical protein
MRAWQTPHDAQRFPSRAGLPIPMIGSMQGGRAFGGSVATMISG